MVTVARFFLSFVRRGVGASERDFFETQQEITTLTVIWARQLLSPQPKLGPVPRSLVYSSVLCRNPRERLALNKSFDDLPVLASARHSRADLNKYTKRTPRIRRNFFFFFMWPVPRATPGPGSLAA